jgi:hypothetical protein
MLKRLEEQGLTASISSVHCWKQELGWTSKQRNKYCQMVQEANVGKHLAWAKENGAKPRYKPRPKHPIKVPVWAGISVQRRTGVCIFKGRMNAPLFTTILRDIGTFHQGS